MAAQEQKYIAGIPGGSYRTVITVSVDEECRIADKDVRTYPTNNISFEG